MKALSLKQPWANWIINGDKTIETRKWNTKFRGRFLIHSSKTVDKFILDTLSHAGEINTEPKGYLIGIASIVDVKKYENRMELSKDFFLHLVPDWYPSKFPIYGFILENVNPIKPIPFKGMLNFFETDLSMWDLQFSYDWIKCSYCGSMVELDFRWRSIGDDDDHHYQKCNKCKRFNNVSPYSKNIFNSKDFTKLK